MRNPALKRLQVSLPEYRVAVQEILAEHRLELLRRSVSWIARAERWIGDYLIAGQDVDVARISPRLELVTSQRQHDVWRYCRLWGTIPYNRGCGRLLRYLLRDDGQPRSPVMGVIALSSPVLVSKPRDEWIGWQYPRDVDLKRRRLLGCMDLSVSMAVPPYNHLTAGKMICLAMLANEVRQDYWTKFLDVRTPTGLNEARLALITTTSLYGSSVQYNRLAVDGRRAYQMIGYTSGYGNAHITEAEFAEMEQYLDENDHPIPKGWGTGRSYRLRVYTAYARHANKEKHAPPHEHVRSIYVAPLAQNTREFLQGKTDELELFGTTFDDLVNAWKQRWLTRRLGNDDVMARFRSANPATLLLSNELREAPAAIGGDQTVRAPVQQAA
jgi:hypothetical protein